ncbi:MAG TPA: hypothetical protein DEQ27_03880 [Prevotella sp.]|nr:hypothetical protein [Prevotella sp.]
MSFKSKVYSQSGTLFLEQDMFDEALTMYRKSYTCDSLLRDTVNMLHSMRDIAQTCKYLNKVDVSESVLKDSYKLSISIDDKLLEESILLSLASLYKSKGEIQRAYEIYSVHLRNVDDRLLSPTNCLALDLYKKMGIIDSVYVYSNRIMETGTIYAKELALSELVNYYSLKKDLLKVSKYLSLYRKMSDSVRVASATESVSRIHMLYNYSLREKKIHEIERNEQKRSIIYLSIFLISLSIFSFVCYLYERNKKKIYEYKSLVSHLEALYELSVSDNLKCKASYEKHIAELNEELSSIQSSLETYEYEVGSEKIHVYELIRRSIKYHKNLSSTDWNCITKSMEIISPRFKEKINSIYPVDSYDYKICMLVKLGFTNSDIATIMCRTDGTISVYRASLYKKFFKIKGKAKDFDNFICSL